jgi:type II secretory pathway pseudopilin PulG
MTSTKMRLALLLKRTKKQPSHLGFSTIEVLVGILLTLTFLGVALQAMVMATSVKIRAHEDNDAASWIQEDIEFVRQEANEVLKLTSEPVVYDVSVNKCSATAAANGYAVDLQTSLNTKRSSPISRNSSIGGRPYRLTRTTAIQDASPHVLRITYRVYRGTETTTIPIATFYTESIPGVAFSCRQEP